MKKKIKKSFSCYSIMCAVKKQIIYIPLVVLFLFSFLLSDAIAGKSDLSIKQGDVAVYWLEQDLSVEKVSANFGNMDVPFFYDDKKKQYYTLLPVDFEKKPGTYALKLKVGHAGGKTEQKNVQVEVKPASFKVQKLSLPKKMVNYSKKDLKRINKEKTTVVSLWPASTGKKMWEGEFLMPIKGRVQGTFGRKRLLNGQARKAHSGEDISAAKGTPVKAINSGTVVNTSHMFFNGKGVFIDHGQGLFSMYFHLSKINVKVGSIVKKGDIIGLVGSTGRATGAHLHVGVRYNGARISPVSLSKVKFN